MKNKAAYTIIALVFVGIFVLMLNTPTNLDLSFGQNYLEIKGIYGDQIPYDSIQSVSRIDYLPLIKGKSNGFAAGKTKIGAFVTSEGKYIMLFVHSDDLFIHIVTHSGSEFYLATKDSQQTDVLYYELLKNMAAHKKEND